MKNTNPKNFGYNSLRLSQFDYNGSGTYHIVIRTADSKCCFGFVEDKKMYKSELGHIAEEVWKKMQKQFDNVILDCFQFMPNHMHGIVIVKKSIENTTRPNQENLTIGGVTGTSNPMLHNGLAKAIRWYKGRTTFEARKLDPDFAWHKRYYDSIIRNQDHLENVRTYIKRNPARWKKDRNGNQLR